MPDTVPVSAEIEAKYCIKYVKLAFKIKFETWNFYQKIGLKMILWHYDFPNFPGGDPPAPPKWEVGGPPLVLSPLAADAAHIMPSAFYAPPPRIRVFWVRPWVSVGVDKLAGVDLDLTGVETITA